MAVVKDICVHGTELCLLTNGERSLGHGPASCVWSQHGKGGRSVRTPAYRPSSALSIVFMYFTELSAANMGSRKGMSPGYTQWMLIPCT